MAYNKLSAMVAGDNAATRSVLSSLLLGLGVGDVRQARDGSEAFRQICARSPDFVLLDFELDGDAMATLEQIRCSPDSPRPNLPVGITVAVVTQASIEAMKRAGVSGVLLKPVSSRQLSACIQSLLSDQGSSVSADRTPGSDLRPDAHNDVRDPVRQEDNSSTDET